MTETHKAVVQLKVGDSTSPEVVAVQDTPMPTLVDGQVLVKVAFSALNPLEWKMVEGVFPLQKKGFLGVDFSGTIEKIADGTETDLQVGDQVYGEPGETKPGTFAEYLAIASSNVAKIPKNVSLMEAASLPCVALTAYQGLTKPKYGDMKAGAKVCITGGSSGVGSAAIQIAKALGASEIWSTGSNPEKTKKLGADKVINYKTESVYEGLKGQQFDIIFDAVGGLDPWMAAMDGGLKKGGKYMTTAGDGDNSIVKLILSWGWRYLKYLVGAGPHYTFFAIDTSPACAAEGLLKVTELVEEGKLKPILDPREFVLTTESMHEMIKASKSHRVDGKLVMKIGA